MSDLISSNTSLTYFFTSSELLQRYPSIHNIIWTTGISSAPIKLISCDISLLRDRGLPRRGRPGRGGARAGAAGPDGPARLHRLARPRVRRGRRARPGGPALVLALGFRPDRLRDVEPADPYGRDHGVRRVGGGGDAEGRHDRRERDHPGGALRRGGDGGGGAVRAAAGPVGAALGRGARRPAAGPAAGRGAPLGARAVTAPAAVAAVRGSRLGRSAEARWAMWGSAHLRRIVAVGFAGSALLALGSLGAGAPRSTTRSSAPRSSRCCVTASARRPRWRWSTSGWPCSAWPGSTWAGRCAGARRAPAPGGCCGSPRCGPRRSSSVSPSSAATCTRMPPRPRSRTPGSIRTAWGRCRCPGRSWTRCRGCGSTRRRRTGPLFLGLGRALATVTGDRVVTTVLAMRLLAVVGVLLTANYLPRLARAAGGDPPIAVWLGLANPLVLMHLVAGAHNDALMIGLARRRADDGDRGAPRALGRRRRGPLLLRGTGQGAGRGSHWLRGPHGRSGRRRCPTRWCCCGPAVRTAVVAIVALLTFLITDARPDSASVGSPHWTPPAWS